MWPVPHRCMSLDALSLLLSCFGRLQSLWEIEPGPPTGGSWGSRIPLASCPVSASWLAEMWASRCHRLAATELHLGPQLPTAVMACIPSDCDQDKPFQLFLVRYLITVTRKMIDRWEEQEPSGLGKPPSSSLSLSLTLITGIPKDFWFYFLLFLSICCPFILSPTLQPGDIHSFEASWLFLPLTSALTPSFKTRDRPQHPSESGTRGTLLPTDQGSYRTPRTLAVPPVSQ